MFGGRIIMTEITVGDFIHQFEQYSPVKFAVPGDPVGLHFGSRKQVIHRMMVTLDVRPEVVDEAIEKNIDFIFAHHPPIFKAPDKLDADDQQQAMYIKLIKNNIAVYAAHTNLDAAPGGMNDWLADLYQINDIEVLSPHTHVSYYRVNAYIPTESVASIHQELIAAGYGKFGNYSGVYYELNGQGHFTPESGANPTIGAVNIDETVEETLYSLLCREDEWQACVDLITEKHPYEEPVIDVVQLANLNQPIGIGRIGNLKDPMPIEDYIQLIKDKTGVNGLRAVLADDKRLVKRVAVLGGDGGKYYPEALAKGADTFITGDIYYHVGHDMIADGLNAIDPGHHFESICKSKLTQLFSDWQEANEWQMTIMPSELNTDPFTFY